MWNLDDTTSHVKIASFDIPWASTYADMRPGHTDRDKRERVRAAAAAKLPPPIPSVRWWSFRVFVPKPGRGRFEVENSVKTILDSFSVRQIRDDASEYQSGGLFEDDAIDYVKLIQIAGERTSAEQSTKMEIFAKPKEPA